MWTFIWRNYLIWRRRWFFFAMMYIITPTLTLYGINENFKHYEGLEGYVLYIIPGFMAYSAILSAFFSTTYGSFTKIESNHVYQGVLATTQPLRNLIMGEIVWNALRSTFVGLCVGMTAWLVYQHQPLSTIILYQLPVVFIGAFSAATMGLAVLSISYSYDDLAIFESVISALFIFSGVFTFVENYPLWIQYLAQIFPLFHTVELMRSIDNILFNSICLAAITLLSYTFAYTFLKRRLLG